MTKTRNVLIIAYIFPPIGGGGVPRPLKMARYLGDFGWGVHVLTADPSYHATLDHTLLAQVPDEVVIHRAKEFSLLPVPAPKAAAQGGGSPGEPGRPSLAARMKRMVINGLKKVKPYLLIPDDQILWYPQALKKGREIMRSHRIDAIFSTSGPVTNHLVAGRLAKEFGCRWIADFRDPWTQNMHRTGIAWRERLEERLEERVMTEADAITTVTATFAANFKRKYGERIRRLELIYNGFDRADFADLEPAYAEEGKFHAVYAGILYQKRNPRLLLRAIRELIDEGMVERDDLLLSFAGVFDYPGYSENTDCVRELGLSDIVRIVGNLPHKEALRLMKSADVQLLIGDVSPDAGAYIPGKLYEYMGIGKPILALNMAGEATEIIQRFRLGQVADPTDKDAIKGAFLRLYREWKAGREEGQADDASRDADFFERVKPYERREQARQLASLLDELTAQPKNGNM
ncbi:glycosyltransferase family 4 protein [Brevibacillus sp. SYP-B805]|uniref:glycosyltransferase family 4 protein n=1 Tax=Brevibacillus sp. SYP-B805 TaxID=1578199 RepID=UPI0013EB2BEE|nr:glycosyltransferase family 4 protein [Brevibacillus sp. SYP-B805]NGQ94434.1 glycosyltransferase family 4 protein [Brevibacillus sp. SYP-B805]